MKIFQKIAQGLIIISLSMLLLPDVFQVWLHTHEHTEDEVSELHGFGIEPQHQHCLELDFYVNSVFFSPAYSFHNFDVFLLRNIIYVSSEIFSNPVHVSLRGPPSFS